MKRSGEPSTDLQVVSAESAECVEQAYQKGVRENSTAVGPALMTEANSLSTTKFLDK